MPGFGTIAVAALLFLYAPLAVTAVYSLNTIRSTTVWGGFSLEWYRAALANPALRSAAWNSLLLAACAASAATLLATLAALSLGRGRPLRRQAAAQALINLPLLVPEIITAISTLVFFVAIGIPLGFPAMILAHAVFCIPFAYLPISARLAGIEPALEDAARDLYSDRWAVVRDILLPLLVPGLVAGFCLAFIVSLDDFIIASFLVGPGSTTLPVAIYGMARFGFSPEINAVCTLLLLVSIGFVSAAWLLGRPRGA